VGGIKHAGRFHVFLNFVLLSRDRLRVKDRL